MRVINDLEVFQEGRIIPEGTLDAFVVSLELAYRELVVLDTTTQMSLLQKESCDIHSCQLSRFCRDFPGFHSLSRIPPGLQNLAGISRNCKILAAILANLAFAS